MRKKQSKEEKRGQTKENIYKIYVEIIYFPIIIIIIMIIIE